MTVLSRKLFYSEAIERKVYHMHCDAALLNFRPKLAAFPSLVGPNDYLIIDVTRGCNVLAVFAATIYRYCFR